MPGFARIGQTSTDIAIHHPHGAMTWAEVDDTLNRAANRLAGLALGAGRVAVVAENSAETALAHIAALLAGCSSVPVSFHLTVDELAYIFEDSGTKIAFAGPETVDRVLAAARVAHVPQVVAWDTPPVGAMPWAAWVADGKPDDPDVSVAPRPNLLYTSGTTGRPKACELPPRMFAGGATVAEHLEALAATNRFADFGAHLVVGPMYHTGPLTGMRLLAAGKPIVILGRFDAERTLQAIEEHRCESSVMVPTHFVRMLGLPDTARSRYDISSLRYVIHTGAPCPADVKRAIIDWWGPVLVDSYGATEVGSVCTITSEDWLTHEGSVGRAVPPFETLVVDEDGADLPCGTEGRLYFRDATGRGIVYANDPAKTAAAHLRPGVFTLGEIGYVDGDGFVYLTDRFSDMVVSGGVNIYPAEVEQVLITHPDVADVACVGIPDAEMGEVLVAAVVPVDPSRAPDVESLLAHCDGRLARFKCPRSLVHLEDLGRTSMGKLDKRALRASVLEASST